MLSIKSQVGLKFSLMTQKVLQIVRMDKCTINSAHCEYFAELNYSGQKRNKVTYILMVQTEATSVWTSETYRIATSLCLLIG